MTTDRPKQHGLFGLAKDLESQTFENAPHVTPAPLSKVAQIFMQLAEEEYEDGLRRVCAAEGLDYVPLSAGPVARLLMEADIGRVLAKSHSKMQRPKRRGRPSKAVLERSDVALASAVNDYLEQRAARGERFTLTQVASALATIAESSGHAPIKVLGTLLPKLSRGRKKLREMRG